jgi:hypothetical protein
MALMQLKIFKKLKNFAERSHGGHGEVKHSSH